MNLRLRALKRVFFRIGSWHAIAIAALILFAAPRASADVPGQLTDDFKTWLVTHGYGGYGFARTDLVGGSFGGKSWSAPTVDREPVIFVHGASDQALGGIAGGWTIPLQSYYAAGYKTSELYATTYAEPVSATIPYLTNSAAMLDYIGTFIEAVLEYTGKTKVNIVSHSFGVTLSRGAIKAYGLGSRVRTFIGIAGTNLGSPGCLTLPYSLTPLCNLVDGVSPYSGYIAYLNNQQGYEGDYRYSIWSMTDDVIGYGCAIAPYLFTCALPGQTNQVVLNGWTHLALRDYTGSLQTNMILSAAL